MEALAASLHVGLNSDPIVRSAMAHLNLVMIHPFRDGNGRMARALATLVLTRSDIGEPEFSSIEEWLGANTDDYYSVLAHTGHGSWQPRDNAHMWLTFNLRAHHMQAQTVAPRDLAALTGAGILPAHGNGRGRYYVAGEPLHLIQEHRRSRRMLLRDPY